MERNYHTFMIPVMGTGTSADTPIRVAPLGITSVISLVDDLLLEQIRAHYSELYHLPFTPIPRHAPDGRARRITAYLNTVQEIVRLRFEAIKALPFFADNDKSLYFDLLPDECALKHDYRRLLQMAAGPERDALARDLTLRMSPGSIDVNIMVKVDRINYDSQGVRLGDEYRDAMAALRGYAQSHLSSALVLSAGINQPMFGYMTSFPDFYRHETGEIKKRIVIKVSDFRSARIQGQYLARKGLEVAEFRIESGLNCGGHAFPSAGDLLPSLLQEFAENRRKLADATRPKILAYYAEQGWDYPEAALESQPLITVQGGIGTHGEAQRLREDFGMDLTGWATPFLLVAEATCVDDTTRRLLARAQADDVYVSDSSPLNIPYSNLRNCGSERWKRERIATGTPGSPCPKGYGRINTEFTEKGICLSSRRYQVLKLAEIEAMDLPEAEKESLRAAVMDKSCICDHLGNSALIALGIAEEPDAPQAICPGPNLVWFDRTYTLREMVDHIYGRGPSLVPAQRPHMFAQELVLYVDFCEKLVRRCTYDPQELRYLETYRRNLEAGMDFLLEIAQRVPYKDENLASIPPCVSEQRSRLHALYAELEAKGAELAAVTGPAA
ncbi:MAG: hypothetical protein L6435_10670 [Anaerolineae bacterium]|nr:hypothetical protein [Anaerolineae bacterium]